MTRLRVGLVGVAVTTLLLAACGTSGDSGSARPEQTSASATPSTPSAPPSPSVQPVTAPIVPPKPGKPVALRAGERRMSLRMPESYTPAAPYGTGTDDYRCFVLNPHLHHDVWLTGTNVQPGTPTEVHHVILYRISPEQAAAAQAKDASQPGQGWTCFGGTGIAGEFDNLDDASWLGAWAPGARESVLRPGYGVRLAAGSLVVMQVHYNLLAGHAPDRSATQLRWRPASAPVKPIHTMLMPAPVELPCRPGHTQSPLCDRAASLADVDARFGQDIGQTANLLHLLCGTAIAPTATTSCTRTVKQPVTVLGAAGHMHLLGRWIKIVANQGTPRQHTLLNIPVWDFDNQGAHPIPPVHLVPGDTVTVTCHHDQSLRDRLPALQGIPDKYVVWGDGTTDEMCLGMLQVAFDSGQ